MRPMGVGEKAPYVFSKLSGDKFLLEIDEKYHELDQVST